VIRFALLFCAVLMFGNSAKADELRPGYLEFTQRTAQDWTLVWKAPMKGGITPMTAPILPKGCSQIGPFQREVIALSVVSKSQYRCTGRITGNFIGLSNLNASQTDVLVRVAPLGRPVQALRLTAAEPQAEIIERPNTWQVAQTYFLIGIEHILFGYDHLLFVVALVLLLRGRWTVAKAVTAFTVAHSITLVGSTIGLLGLPQRPVESVIALSIVFLAVEITKQKPGTRRLSERMPWVVAFLFGLLHGFGFAGALNEIGLPESDVPTALLTFNIGVEIGQLAIVLATGGLLLAGKQVVPVLVRPAIRIATMGIGITASYWFIERTLT
jgi:hydrogenase/urease accessory protein HupE